MAAKILGIAVWRAGRWYLRRRAPRMRATAVRRLAGLGAAAAAAAAFRRASG